MLNSRLLEAELLRELPRGKVKCVAENRERDVNSTRNHALDDLLSFADVDDVSILND